MTHITTRQRDLIQILTNSNSNLGIKSLADQLNLSPRQVQYDLVEIRTWLKIRGVSLMMKPGVGVCLESTSLQKQIIMEELKHSTHIQLILTPKQRQQLIIFLFLTSDEAIILNHLQYVLQVSRTTILKDLESVELWFQEKDIHFLRRTNFGFQIDCSEKQRREGLTQALWGNNEDTETPFMRMSHINGLQFEFKEDYERLEILAQTNQIFKTLNTRQVMRRVTYAEAQLGGRFTDDAVLYLSLVYAVQAYRANQKKYIKIPEEAIQWVKERLAWPVAQHIAKNLALNPYHI
jgi:transcriptional antiterminator